MKSAFPHAKTIETKNIIIMKQLEMLYEGKAKQVFLTDDPDKIIIHYKDAATAFNNVKKATIENKGVLNNAISTLIFKELHKAGVKTDRKSVV